MVAVVPLPESIRLCLGQRHITSACSQRETVYGELCTSTLLAHADVMLGHCQRPPW